MCSSVLVTTFEESVFLLPNISVALVPASFELYQAVTLSKY